MYNIYIFSGSFQSWVVYMILLQYVFIMKVENTETSTPMFSWSQNIAYRNNVELFTFLFTFIYMWNYIRCRATQVLFHHINHL